VRRQRILDLGRIDVAAADGEPVGPAVRQVQVLVLVEMAEIARRLGNIDPSDYSSESPEVAAAIQRISNASGLAVSHSCVVFAASLDDLASGRCPHPVRAALDVVGWELEVIGSTTGYSSLTVASKEFLPPFPPIGGRAIHPTFRLVG
jgi:hypothetical protein